MSMFNDLARNRAARAQADQEARPFVVVRLTARGTVNKMTPAKGFHTPAEARLYIAQIRGYNLGKIMRFAVNGLEM